MFEIRYVDNQLIIALKPAGLLSVPGRGEDKQDCMVARVQAQWPDARTVHRLDQVTSGLMVFARDADTHRTLSAAFAAREVEKTYEALVEGRVPAGSGIIDLPLICDWPNRPRQIVDHAQGKPSETRWSIIERGDRHTRLRLEPVTGRSHQLRVHLQAIGHPIVGDTFYGAQPAARVMLHACHLAFRHPGDATWRTFTDAAPF